MAADEAFPISEVVLKGPPENRVFVLTFPHSAPLLPINQLREAWNAAWNNAGYEKAPALLVLQEGYTLSSLTDDMLQQVGLLRIQRETDKS